MASGEPRLIGKMPTDWLRIQSTSNAWAVSSTHCRSSVVPRTMRKFRLGSRRTAPVGAPNPSRILLSVSAEMFWRGRAIYVAGNASPRSHVRFAARARVGGRKDSINAALLDDHVSLGRAGQSPRARGVGSWESKSCSAFLKVGVGHILRRHSAS